MTRVKSIVMKISWSIVVKNDTETSDDEGMDHCDDKVLGALG